MGTSHVEMFVKILLLALAVVSHAFTDTGDSGPEEIDVPGFPEMQKCLQIFEETVATYQKDVLTQVGQGDVDLTTIFYPICDSLLNFTKCLQSAESVIDVREMIKPMLGQIPMLLSACQERGILTDAPQPTDRITTDDITHDIVSTEPTTANMKTTRHTTTPEPTTSEATATHEPTTSEATTTPEPTTSESTTTPEVTTEIEVRTKATTVMNRTTTQSRVETETPTEPRDTDCFKENLRTSGAVIEQVRYSSDEDCKKLCYRTEGCQAVVTSPMSWYWTECFIIGEYTLTTNNAYGWDTAERECFDSDFSREVDPETRPPIRSTTESANRTTTQPPTENPTEPRDTDCFKENLRTSGPVIEQVRYSSDEDCKKLCYRTEGCQAVVTSPMSWYWTECFIIGEYTLTTNNAYGWDTAEREC